jgi:hypothetical protein
MSYVPQLRLVLLIGPTGSLLLPSPGLTRFALWRPFQLLEEVV